MLVLAVLLVSMLILSGPYSMMYASSSLDQSNSTSQIPGIPIMDNHPSQTEYDNAGLSIYNNTVQLIDNQYVVFLPKYHNTTHVSIPLKSKLTITASKLVGIGAIPRNDSYCFPYAYFGE